MALKRYDQRVLRDYMLHMTAGDKDAVRAFYDHYSPFETSYKPDYISALCYAVTFSAVKEEMIKFAVDCGEDIDYAGGSGSEVITPLSRVVLSPDLEPPFILKRSESLLRFGANPNALVSRGYGRQDTAASLLVCSAVADAKNTKMRDEDIAKFIDLCFKHGMTKIMLNYAGDQSALHVLLVNAGVNPESSLLSKFEQTARTLIKHGADPDSGNKLPRKLFTRVSKSLHYRFSPKELEIAADILNDPEIRRIPNIWEIIEGGPADNLIRAYPSLSLNTISFPGNIKNAEGDNPLVATLKILVKNESLGKDYRANRAAMVWLLKDHYSLNIPDREGMTPLMYMARCDITLLDDTPGEYGSVYDIKEWVKGGKWSIKDRYGATAVHHFARFSSPSSILELAPIWKESEINAIDRAGRTPYDYAKMHENDRFGKRNMELISDAGGESGLEESYYIDYREGR